MKTRIALMAAALFRNNIGRPCPNYGPQRDPNGYYSQADQRGYYDRNGRYRQMRARNDRGNRGDWGAGTRYDQSSNYYRQGEYEQSCRRGNVVAGTIFGAAAGGLVGSAVSHGNGGASLAARCWADCWATRWSRTSTVMTSLTPSTHTPMA